MEISASEIRLLCRRISSSIEGYTVSSVYSIEEGILLRLRHEIKEEKLIAVSSFATWITTKNISLQQADSSVADIREQVERARLVNVKQEGNERIATFALESRTGEKRNLHAEFFGGGNIIITDSDEQIRFVRNPQHFRHRNLVVGERYILPPSRGRNIEAIDESYLSVELERARSDPKSLKMAAIRWFGRAIATSRKFIEEIFFRSEIDSDRPISELQPVDLAKLAKISSELAQEIEASNNGFLLIPNAEDERSEIDVCPIVPHSWKEKQQQLCATICEFESFDQALDEAQVQAFLLEKKTKASKEIRGRAGELESAIRKQDILFQKNEQTAKELRRLGSELIRSVSSHGLPEEVATTLVSMSLLEKDLDSNNELRFVNEPRAFLKSFATPQALASRLFDEAKSLEQTNRSITEIRTNLIRRKDSLLEQSKTSEDRAAKRVAIERRAKQWFERYRWFLTSDRRLAIGGRDSTSNSIVINKYTDQNCIVFHADLHGSPFFVLKNGRENGSPRLDQEIEHELAQATVSFSRAWKDELGSADAYWVEPEQIKKSAPSGEYLPRGSFFIEGKKNFVKHLRVELCIGIMSSQELPGESDTNSEQGKTEMVSPIVVCGPDKALAKYCISRVKLAPGKERGMIVGRKIKQILVSRIKEVEKTQLKELAKKIPVDDIIHVLPSGSYKIVMEKQNG
jgi:predicted ribosome quality control (RQC) complex YloA/Tae2 family protein